MKCVASFLGIRNIHKKQNKDSDVSQNKQSFISSHLALYVNVSLITSFVLCDWSLMTDQGTSSVFLEPSVNHPVQ